MRPAALLTTTRMVGTAEMGHLTWDKAKEAGAPKDTRRRWYSWQPLSMSNIALAELLA